MTDNNVKVHPEGNRPRVEKIFELKSTSTRDGRYVRALASVFGNVDYQGDRTMPGAFTASLKKWAASGKSIPVIFSHDWGNPFSHIGVVTSAKETDVGLEIEAELDVEDNEVAKQVYRLMRRGTLSEWSFAYSVIREKKASDGATELIEVDLFEVGPTLKGANPETATLDVKAESRDDYVTRELASHLRTSHSVTGRQLGRSLADLRATHRLAHAGISASANHINTGSVDGDVEIPTSGKDSTDYYRWRIDQVVNGKPPRRPKSDAELRAEVNRLYDEHVLPAKLEQLKADEAIFGARVRRRGREEKQRAIKRTEAPR